jgi:haloalkane dehalogenase
MIRTDRQLKKAPVLGSSMAYYDSENDKESVVLFLHGNPTSSYIWRNIIPHVETVARCIAPDLIGFGESDKPDIEYRFTDHVRYLDAFIESLGLKNIFIVAQDWGTALAFHFTARHPRRIQGLAFMEFIRPMPTWDDFHQNPVARATFQKFRTAGEGEAMILESNAFIERVLPNAVLRQLSKEEMDAYRAPFPTPESRKPIWRFPNELPIAGEPADVYQMMQEAHAVLLQSEFPKLLFAGDPGALVSSAFAEEFASQLKNCQLVHLGPGAHYLQEDHPDAIGKKLTRWIAGIGYEFSEK